MVYLVVLCYSTAVSSVSKSSYHVLFAVAASASADVHHSRCDHSGGVISVPATAA